MTARELFSEGLRRMMNATGTSCEKLSDGSGVSIRQVKRLVSGECFPSSDKVISGIAKYFNCEESDILGYGFGYMGEAK